MFVFDYDKKIDVIQKSWHYMAEGNYISNTYNTDEIKSKQLYLHNFVMDKLTFEGKGTQHTIDHINRIGTDNRKVNLRNLESQTAQNFNQKKEKELQNYQMIAILMLMIYQKIYIMENQMAYMVIFSILN
jgi:hypothetical protein